MTFLIGLLLGALLWLVFRVLLLDKSAPSTESVGDRSSTKYLLW